MAVRFLDTDVSLVQDTVNSYLDQTLSNYTKYLNNTTPIYVTFFSKDNAASGSGGVLENTIDLLGETSNTFFNQIKNIPIYNISEMSWATEESEFGLESTADGEGIIIPDTVVPNCNDYFIVHSDGNEVVYRISDVEVSNISDKTYYKISFFVANDSYTELVNQVSNKQELVLDNTDFTIINETNIQKLKTIKDCKQVILDQFLTYFYNKDIFAFKDTKDETFYINSNGLNFLMKEDLLDGHYIRHDTLQAVDKYSIYEAIKSNMCPLNLKAVIVPVAPTPGNPLYYTWYRSIDIAFPTKIIVDDINTLNVFDEYGVENSSDPLWNLVNLFINETLTDEDLIKHLKADKYSFVKNNLESFVNVPILLYVIKVIEQKLLK